MADGGNPRTGLQSTQKPGTVLAFLVGGPSSYQAPSSAQPTLHTCETHSTTGHWHHGLGIYLPQALFFSVKYLILKEWVGSSGLRLLRK